MCVYVERKSDKTFTYEKNNGKYGYISTSSLFILHVHIDEYNHSVLFFFVGMEYPEYIDNKHKHKHIHVHIILDWIKIYIFQTNIYKHKQQQQ